MIRINLLPTKRGRVSKKALDLRNFLIVAGGAAGVVVLLGGLTSWVVSGKVSGLETERNSVEGQLNLLKVKSAKIVNYEDDRKSFEDKIQVIRDLKRDQGRPVRFLDVVASRLPNRVWLISLQENNGTVTLVGRAVANSDIVEMLQRMKEAKMLGNIQLVESRRLREDGSTAYEFTMTARITEATPT